MPLLIALCLSTTAVAQKPPIKFGDIPMEQMQMKVYPKDSSASAVVLADYGESSIDYATDKFLIRFERIRRVKILNKDGYDWGNLTIPLYRDGSTIEDVSSLKGVTYNLEGNKIVETKMKNDMVFKEAADQNVTYMKVAMPNVKEGSVVEISYKITSPFIYNFQDWNFQTTIPTVWSEYRTRIPDWFTYKRFVQGYLAVSINENKTEHKAFSFHTRVQTGSSLANTKGVDERVEYEENYNRLVIQDVPAFKSEPYITTYQNYISRINFELSVVKIPDQQWKTYNDSWEDLNQDFLKAETFGGVVRGSGFLKDEAAAVTAGKTDPKEKIAAVYGFVRNNVEWDGSYRKYSDGNLRQVIATKKGSCAEINLMLVSMLQKAGITANPVLISTRDHGFVRRDLPVESQFNYVIAAVELEGKTILLDATDRSLPMGTLPKRCLNGEGFIIAPDNKAGWIGLSAPKSRTSATTELIIATDGSMNGKFQFSHDGYFAQRIRSSYYTKGKEEYLKDVASTNLWELQGSEFENLDKLSEPVKEIYQLKLAEHIQVTGDNMYINPMLVHRIEKNPFQQEKREYPVDFGSAEDYVLIARITVPEGWVVEELPQAKALVMPANSARYTYNIAQTGNIISLTSILNINKALFSHDEYTPLRDFYAQIVAKQAEQIVLKKK
jgi:transglutaminase-like putative cysteine protease